MTQYEKEIFGRKGMVAFHGVLCLMTFVVYGIPTAMILVKHGWPQGGFETAMVLWGIIGATGLNLFWPKIIKAQKERRGDVW